MGRWIARPKCEICFRRGGSGLGFFGQGAGGLAFGDALFADAVRAGFVSVDLRHDGSCSGS